MKKKFVDNNVTIANMNVSGMPWYRKTGKTSVKEKIVLSKKERHAAIKGMLEVILPLVMLFTIGILLIFLFIYFIWL